MKKAEGFWILVTVGLSGMVWSWVWDYLRCKADRVSVYRSIFYDQIGNGGVILCLGCVLMAVAIEHWLVWVVCVLVCASLFLYLWFSYLAFKASDPLLPTKTYYENCGQLGCVIPMLLAVIIAVVCAVRSGWVS